MSVFGKNVKGPEGDKETKSSSASESTAPAVKNETARKEKWRAMAEQREIWDQELIEATQIAKVKLLYLSKNWLTKIVTQLL